MTRGEAHTRRIDGAAAGVAAYIEIGDEAGARAIGVGFGRDRSEAEARAECAAAAKARMVC